MIIDLIKAENLTARKRKDKFVSGIMTCLIGEIEIVGKNAGNRKTTDEEAVKVIRKFLKGVEEVYMNTYDLMKKDDLKNEIEIYKAFLPKLMTEEELSKLIYDMISTSPNPDKVNIGMIMGQLKKSGKDYDGKMASGIIKDLLK